MSINMLRIIPDLPSWVPDDEVASRLSEAADRLFGEHSRRVTAEDRGEISFIDQGEWFEKIECPNCGSEIEDAWWQDRMSEAYANNFSDLSIRTPCCNSVMSLNDLVYRLPAGFARFVIEIEELDQTYAREDAIALLSQISGRPMRQIAARY